MVTNFDYLKTEPKFSRFADVAISAERIVLMDPEASIINCRRYEVDYLIAFRKDLVQHRRRT